MHSITCPHGCGVTFDPDQALVSNHVLSESPSGDGRWRASTWRCPTCDQTTVDLVREHQGDASVIESHRVWPREGRVAAAEVPSPYRDDFREAASIVDLSPQASAAIGRRCLQAILVDRLGAPKSKRLEAQIDAVIDAVPSHVGEGLHALRVVGNFSAHPIKDTETGAVVPVEAGEAEWTLDTLETLFDHVFVAPVKAAARREALNEKLAAAKKPLLGADGRPVKANESG